MKEYSTVFVLQSRVNEEEAGEVSRRLSEIIKNEKGHIFFERPLGKKTLAYPMNKQKEGFYFHLDYAAGSSVVGNMEKILRYDERVLRFMTTVVSPFVDIAKRTEELKTMGGNENEG